MSHTCSSHSQGSVIVKLVERRRRKNWWYGRREENRVVTELNGDRTSRKVEYKHIFSNTLLITSVYHKSHIKEKIYNTSPKRSFIEIEPRFEFYTSLFLCRLSAPVCLFNESEFVAAWFLFCLVLSCLTMSLSLSLRKAFVMYFLNTTESVAWGGNEGYSTEIFNILLQGMKSLTPDNCNRPR